MQMQRFVLATLTAGSLFACFSAAQGASLSEFTGVWAHSASDCEAQLSGRLDKMDNATSSKYEVIGICSDGIDIFHQPVECSISKVNARDNKIEFFTACYVKDYPADKRSPGAIVASGRNANAILLNIKSENYSLSGNYMKCTKDYRCIHMRYHP